MNGEAVGEAGDFEVSFEGVKAKAKDLGKALGECFGEYIFTIDAEQSRALLNLIDPPQRGATEATLARRVEYGGRKGRSAWRRLRAKGYVGTMRINDERPVPLPPFRIT